MLLSTVAVQLSRDQPHQRSWFKRVLPVMRGGGVSEFWKPSPSPSSHLGMTTSRPMPSYAHFRGRSHILSSFLGGSWFGNMQMRATMKLKFAARIALRSACPPPPYRPRPSLSSFHLEPLQEAFHAVRQLDSKPDAQEAVPAHRWMARLRSPILTPSRAPLYVLHGLEGISRGHPRRRC